MAMEVMEIMMITMITMMMITMSMMNIITREESTKEVIMMKRDIVVLQSLTS